MQRDRQSQPRQGKRKSGDSYHCQTGDRLQHHRARREDCICDDNLSPNRCDHPHISRSLCPHEKEGDARAHPEQYGRGHNMRPFEPKIDLAHAATSSTRVVIFQRANSGANSESVKNPMQGNAPDLNTSPRAKRRARMFAAMQGISGPSIAGAVSCQVRRTRAPPSLRLPTTLTRIPPFSPAPASNIPAKRFRLTAQRATGNGKPIRRNAASPQRARCCAPNSNAA